MPGTNRSLNSDDSSEAAGLTHDAACRQALDTLEAKPKLEGNDVSELIASYAKTRGLTCTKASEETSHHGNLLAFDRDVLLESVAIEGIHQAHAANPIDYARVNKAEEPKQQRVAIDRDTMDALVEARRLTRAKANMAAHEEQSMRGHWRWLRM